MIKKLIITMGLILTSGLFVFSQPIQPPLEVTETDGSPSVYPYRIKFTTSTVTDNADGTATINNIGLSGGSLTLGSVLFATSSGLVTQDNTNFYWDNTNKRLGIGTATPNNRLQVKDLINFDNTNFSASLGFEAGKNLLSDGLYNIAIGYRALHANTSSDHNTALGYMTLYSNTTGYSNTGIGSFALTSNTTGFQNIALGYNSLRANTTGNYNIAMGNNALYTNTDGYDNTAIGREALFSNTSGYFNFAFGPNSLRANTTGHSNIAMGNYAIRNSTTGYGNIALGYMTLNHNTNSIANTAIGYQAGFGVSGTSNRYNTLIGYQAGRGLGEGANNNALIGYLAGYNISTGRGNIAIGYQAGDNITTGMRNIILGYDIDAPSATGSYQLSIGNLIFGTNLDGTGTTISSGNVGIRVSAPENILTILQNSPTDPIADAWTVYPSSREHKTITANVNPHGYLDKIKAINLYKFKRKAIVSDEEAKGEIPAKQIEVSEEEALKDGALNVGYEYRDERYYKFIEPTAEEIEVKKLEIKERKALLPKFSTERVGIMIDDLNIPAEILVFDEKGNKIGIDLLAYIGYLHACIKELAEKDKSLK